MERLTERRDAQWVIPLRQDGKQKWALCKAGMSLDDSTEYLYGDHANRLAAYEDTGLEPEEVTQVKLALIGKSLAEIKEFDGVPIDRIVELARAEKEGRLVVLPVNPYLKPTQQNEMYICEEGEVWAIYVTGCEAGPNCDGVFTVLYSAMAGYYFSADDIGKTVFRTYEEAEAALKKGEEADNEAD